MIRNFLKKIDKIFGATKKIISLCVRKINFMTRLRLNIDKINWFSQPGYSDTGACF